MSDFLSPDDTSPTCSILCTKICKSQYFYFLVKMDAGVLVAEIFTIEPYVGKVIEEKFETSADVLFLQESYIRSGASIPNTQSPFWSVCPTAWAKAALYGACSSVASAIFSCA